MEGAHPELIRSSPSYGQAFRSLHSTRIQGPCAATARRSQTPREYSDGSFPTKVFNIWI